MNKATLVHALELAGFEVHDPEMGSDLLVVRRLPNEDGFIVAVNIEQNRFKMVDEEEMDLPGKLSGAPEMTGEQVMLTMLLSRSNR